QNHCAGLKLPYPVVHLRREHQCTAGSGGVLQRCPDEGTPVPPAPFAHRKHHAAHHCACCPPLHGQLVRRQHLPIQLPGACRHIGAQQLHLVCDTLAKGQLLTAALLLLRHGFFTEEGELPLSGPNPAAPCKGSV